MHSVGQYTVDIYTDEHFKEDSSDNLHQYNFVYFKESEFQYTTTLGIKVFSGDKLVASAIIGAAGIGTGVHDSAAVYEDDRVVICCSDSIFCLSIPQLELLWQTRADDATCFEIYKYKDSYIVHGELEISRLDREGNILWQQSGADIFTTIDGEDSFELKEDYIIARDFEGRIYKYDYDGKYLSDDRIKDEQKTAGDKCNIEPYETPWDFLTKFNTGAHTIAYQHLTEFAQGGPLVGELHIDDKKVETYRFGGPFLLKENKLYVPVLAQRFVHNFRLAEVDLESHHTRAISEHDDLIWPQSISGNGMFYYTDLKRQKPLKYASVE